MLLKDLVIFQKRKEAKCSCIYNEAFKIHDFRCLSDTLCEHIYTAPVK